MSTGPTPKGRERRTALLDAAERVLTSSGGSALLDGVLSDNDDPALVRLFTEVWALAAHDQEAAAAVRAFYDQYATHVAALFRSGVAGRRSTGTDTLS
ncbi:TetR family transcriptional regulator C-terminal domain-containing protein [Streptomyces sp. TRM72054]|uniref:TetR family transcriptional regulator C-terminal domain-containing protein n=1 Tax=Streptomyces TaxID=1883 RepID=UPI00148934B0|nr:MULTISPECIES: TetR family transcriptional regulator C-terminal domain-containing protein [Streptomyces]MBX9397688.1 TetR family transcriptional regulator C-terminal domain-containing protein [Streptomyces sp. TRM72054]